MVDTVSLAASPAGPAEEREWRRIIRRLQDGGVKGAARYRHSRVSGNPEMPDLDSLRDF